ncbi:MAG: putative metal-binding motif-containing protein, partial [Fidelibacterota bacterium]
MSAFIRKLITIISIGFMFFGYASAQDDPPAEFQFNQSTLQAFYFIESATLDGIELTNDDWIGVFNGTICVGSVQWAGAYTTVPAMGDENESWTEGYLSDGDIPIFKMYDASQNQFITIVTASDVDPGLEWHTNSFVTIGMLSGLSSPAEFQFNQSTLQAFYFIESADLDGTDLTSEDWIGVFNEDVCVGAAPWSGPYTTIPAMGDEGESWTVGYLNDGDIPTFKIFDASDNTIYQSVVANDVTPGLEWHNNSFITVGALNGYTAPLEFQFNQSSQQAFYFIISADIDNAELTSADWIGVFNGDVCVGAINWQGAYTAVPAMGDDGQPWTAGYLTQGDIPQFRVYHASSDSIYTLVTVSDVDPGLEWVNLALINIGNLSVNTTDCAGIINGSAVVDECGVCCSGTTGVDCSFYNDESDFGGAYDCAGVCAGSAQLLTYCEDDDTDGYGNDGTQTEFCDAFVIDPWVLDCTDPVPGCTSNTVDCADVCDGFSEIDFWGDCCEDPMTLFQDADGDGLGNPDILQSGCILHDGWVENNLDDDDQCTSNQFDCLGICDGTNFNTYYADTDSDTYGDPDSTIQACDPPEGFVTNADDCDDSNENINPDMTDETCDGVDNDCNDMADDGYVPTATECGVGVCYATGTLDCIDGNE